MMSATEADCMSEGLSVILPLYNGANFVKAAIQSVVEQESLPTKWEIIVVDDASTDNGAEYCQQLAELYPQIRIEKHEANRGVAAARNRGIGLAKYEYLSFLDQDDQWARDKWQVQSKALRHSNVNFVLGHQSFELQNPDKPPHWFRQSWLQEPQKGYVFGALLIAKIDFMKVGLLCEEYMFGADDVDWFVRLRESDFNGIMLDDVVLHRHVHEHNASARTKQSNLELLSVIRAKLGRQA